MSRFINLMRNILSSVHKNINKKVLIEISKSFSFLISQDSKRLEITCIFKLYSMFLGL